MIPYGAESNGAEPDRQMCMIKTPIVKHPAGSIQEADGGGEDQKRSLKTVNM